MSPNKSVSLPMGGHVHGSWIMETFIRCQQTHAVFSTGFTQCPASGPRSYNEAGVPQDGGLKRKQRRMDYNLSYLSGKFK